MKEAIDDLTTDTAMEIKRDNIVLGEKTLGEGAFGLVKHAILIRDGKKCEVAVKMLKSKKRMTDIIFMIQTNLPSSPRLHEH